MPSFLSTINSIIKGQESHSLTSSGAMTLTLEALTGRRLKKLKKGSVKRSNQVSYLLKSVRSLNSRFLDHLPLAIAELKKILFLDIKAELMWAFGLQHSDKEPRHTPPPSQQTVPLLQPKLKSFLNQFEDLQKNQPIDAYQHVQTHISDISSHDHIPQVPETAKTNHSLNCEKGLYYKDISTKLVHSQLPQHTGEGWKLECPISLESFGHGDEMALLCKESDKLAILANPKIVPQGSYLFDCQIAKQIVNGSKQHPMTREPVDSYIHVKLSRTNQFTQPVTPSSTTKAPYYTKSEIERAKLDMFEAGLYRLGQDLIAGVNAIRLNLIPKTQTFISSLDDCTSYFLTERGHINTPSLQGLRLLDNFLTKGFTFPSLSDQFSVPEPLRAQFNYLRHLPDQSADLKGCYHHCESMLEIGQWAHQLDQVQTHLEKRLGVSNKQDEKISSLLADLIALQYQLQEIERFMASYKYNYIGLIKQLTTLPNPDIASYASFLQAIIHTLRTRFEQNRHTQEIIRKQL